MIFILDTQNSFLYTFSIKNYATSLARVSPSLFHGGIMLLRFVLMMVSIGLLGFGAGFASGQDYPTKPIHIVTLSAGGGTDFMTRLVVQGIGNSLGQPLVVDNK